MNIPEQYKKYHIDKDHTSIGLFRVLKEKFEIRKVLYPGSHVHITPSLTFSNVTYIDSFRNTNLFFKSEELMKYLNTAKEYSEELTIKFLQQDYYTPLLGVRKDIDMVISQYAGFVGQAVKPHLKKGGILVCNNSHGDASMANVDSDYKLIAIYSRKSDTKFSISEKSLEEYLIPKKGIHPTREEIIKLGRGIAYTKSPSGYIFQKIK